MTSSQVDFTTLSEMTDADKRMNPMHFGSDPTDIWTRINPEYSILALEEFTYNNIQFIE